MHIFQNCLCRATMYDCKMLIHCILCCSLKAAAPLSIISEMDLSIANQVICPEVGIEVRPLRSRVKFLNIERTEGAECLQRKW